MTTTSLVSSATTNSTAQAVGLTGSQQLAGNFDTFLQLLTTQLQNQNPLDPLDTNQFTQQLVEFASVEQQVDMNTNLNTLITLQQSTAATAALQLVGSTVTVSGDSANLSNSTQSPAAWSLDASAPGTANITIKDSTGQTAYSGTMSLNAGTQSFTWSGKGNSGVIWPDGAYTISVSATGANGQPVTVSTQVQGTVTGVDMSANPPALTVNAQSVPISSITSVGSTGTSSLTGLSSLGSSIDTLNSTIGTLISSL
jgi:flagellar basal-body rod modification protein FlgD